MTAKGRSLPLHLGAASDRLRRNLAVRSGTAECRLTTPSRPLPAIGAVTMVVSATAWSWHGIMLSEAARLAPPGRVGAVTGGVLSFGQIGALSSPAVFSLLLGLSGGYSAGWVVCAVPAVLVGVNMFRQGKHVPAA